MIIPTHYEDLHTHHVGTTPNRSYLWAPIILYVLVTLVLSRLKVEKANEELLAVRKA